MSILMTEYDYATDIAVKQEEAFEEGISIGLERGAYEKSLETARTMLLDGFAAEVVAKYTNLPYDNNPSTFIITQQQNFKPRGPQLPGLGAIRAVSQAHRGGEGNGPKAAPHLGHPRGGASQHPEGLP